MRPCFCFSLYKAIADISEKECVLAKAWHCDQPQVGLAKDLWSREQLKLLPPHLKSFGLVFGITHSCALGVHCGLDGAATCLCPGHSKWCQLAAAMGWGCLALNRGEERRLLGSAVLFPGNVQLTACVSAFGKELCGSCSHHTPWCQQCPHQAWGRDCSVGPSSGGGVGWGRRGSWSPLAHLWAFLWHFSWAFLPRRLGSRDGHCHPAAVRQTPRVVLFQYLCSYQLAHCLLGPARYAPLL